MCKLWCPLEAKNGTERGDGSGGGRRQEESSHKAFSLGSLRRRLLERGAPVSSWREGGGTGVCVGFAEGARLGG